MWQVHRVVKTSHMTESVTKDVSLTWKHEMTGKKIINTLWKSVFWPPEVWVASLCGQSWNTLKTRGKEMLTKQSAIKVHLLACSGAGHCFRHQVKLLCYSEFMIFSRWDGLGTVYEKWCACIVFKILCNSFSNICCIFKLTVLHIAVNIIVQGPYKDCLKA